MYFDLDGESKGLNEKTGDTISIKFYPRSWKSGSYITGKAMDKSGKVKFEITGSWCDKILIKNLQSDETQIIWTKA